MFQGKPGWDLSATGVDVQLFDALVAALSQQYCVDPNRIFSTGHSFGAFFTNRLGCSRGNVLRAIAPVAGAPPVGGTNCSGDVAAWITHGQNDPTVPFTQGEATRDFWRSRNSCSTMSQATPPSPCVAFQSCTQPVHWCAHTGGHEWPSFAAGGIWTFFNSF
jgi:poly(3-hydroxybutyrate) depolymerase